MSLQISTWYDEIAVNAHGASLPGIEQALHSAIAEFLRRSGAYAKAITPMDIKADRQTYIISKQPEGPILFIHGVFYKSFPLQFTDAFSWERRKDASVGTVYRFRAYVDDPYKFTVYPTPSVDENDALTPYVAFGYDKRCNEYIPDIFSTQWYDVILSGALYRLMAQPNKPYTNPVLSAMHGRMFRQGIATARDQARKQFVVTDTPISFPAWA